MDFFRHFTAIQIKPAILCFPAFIISINKLLNYCIHQNANNAYNVILCHDFAMNNYY